MGSLSNYGENKFLEHLCSTAYTPVAEVYLALCTADPGEAATGASCNEIADANGYVRTAINFGAASGRRITQSGVVTFPEASGSWGTITHWAIIDSATYGEGNVLAYGTCTPSFAPATGNTPNLSSGQVYIEFAAGGGTTGVGYTSYFVRKMLDLIFRNQAYSQPATYLALLDTAGEDSDTTLTTAGKEVSGTGYARLLINKAAGSNPAWNAVANGATDNATIATFAGVGSGGWSTIVGAAIVDGGTLDAGNVLAYDNSNVGDQTPVEGDSVYFAAGAFDLSVT